MKPAAATENEAQVLGVLIAYPDEALPLVREALRPADFSSEGQRLLFSAILALAEAAGTVDLPMLSADLRQRGILGRVGGDALLTQLHDNAGSARTVPYHVRQIRKSSLARRRQDFFQERLEAGDRNGAAPEDLLAEDAEALQRIRRDAAPSGGDATHPALDAPVLVLRKARDAGEPIPTGLMVLDERLRGGMRLRKAMAIGGTAGAGKTSLLIQIGRAAAESGCAVAGLMADEGREAAIIRLGQQLGYSRDALEAGDDVTLEALEKDLASRPMFFPDPDDEADATIEGAIEAVVQAYPGHRKLVLLDSIQTVTTRRGAREFSSLRERIMENARTARRLAEQHNLAVIYTSEVNRGWYRARKEAERASDLSAFAEARIEFSADVLLTMRASDDDQDLVDIRLPKNRLGDRRSFLVRLDRARASFTAMDGDPLEALRDMAQTRRVEAASAEIIRILQAHPNLTRKQVLDGVGGKREAAVEALGALRKAGIVLVTPQGARMLHRLAEAPER